MTRRSRSQPHHPSHPIRPLRTAVWLAVGYLVLCSAYIVLSSAEAARLAGSVVELHRFERWKGLFFVAATGALFFGLAWWMLERIARQSRQLHRQRELLEALEGPALAGSFSAAIAHDLNNVLGVAKAGLGGLTGADPARRERSASLVGRAVDDLRRISERMARLARRDAGPVLALEDLAEIVRETVLFGRRHPRIGRCTFEQEIPAALPAEIDRSLVQRAVLNLLLNAAEASQGTGHIRVELRRDPRDLRFAEIAVDDDGPGVEERSREEIFSIFHTTKEEGSGLGLFSVRTAAEAHGGGATVGASPLGGASFQLRLRVVAERDG